jgi:outer membrane protein assembly factor BamB
MIRKHLALFLLFPGILSDVAFADTNWPEFRGPRGDGSSDATGLPLNWTERGAEDKGGESIRWKTTIHGRAWSSPVVWDKQIWLTSATEDGHEYYALCIDRDSGKILQDLHLFHVDQPQAGHDFNTFASPTPAIEEGRVYVVFGVHGNACLDTKTGKVLWERRDLQCNHYRNAGSSPILYGDLVFLNFDGIDVQYLVAIDKRTGRTVWKKDRSVDFRDLEPDGRPQGGGDFRKAFATCTMATLDGQPTLLSQGAKAFYAFEPRTGEELWRVEERSNHSGATRPLMGHGLIFFPTGFSTGQLLAIRPGKKGEVLDVNAAEAPTNQQLKLAWRVKRNVPKKPSLLLVGDLLFGLDDIGVVTCWDAKTGETVWNERIGGNYSASPLAAEGRIYCFSEEGKTVVLAASREFKQLAENRLESGFMASPAVTGKALILRTKTHLYRIEAGS